MNPPKPKINMVPVTSSRMKSIGITNAGMVVEFHNGETYGYAGVPALVFTKLLRSKSPGKMLNSIQKQYKYKKL